MLIVRFKETFRERSAEWAQAAGMIAWGLLTLTSKDLFTEQEFFTPLLNITSQANWGITAALIGFLRLIFLVINGAWRPSAHIRAMGCVFGTMLWGSLFIAGLSLTWVTPATALYGTLLGLDLLSLWFAAGDAKLADLSVKGKTKTI